MYTIVFLLMMGAVIIGWKYRVWIDSHLGWSKPYVFALMTIVLFGTLLTVLIR